MHSKKILVTGASGFIGSCLARHLLEKGDEVHLFLREGSKQWRLQDVLPRFQVHKVDLANRESVFSAVSGIRPDVIYHLATYGAYAQQKDPQLSVSTNVLGTMNLADSCREFGGAMVNVSTSSEYGIKNHPIREDDVLEPNSLYGVSKSAATLYCSHLSRDFGVPITTFRIFAAYGYYEEPMRLIPSLIVSYLKNAPPRLASPDSVRDFIFIEDIISAFEKAPDTPAAKGQILNLACGKQHTISELATVVKKLTGSSLDPVWGSTQKKQSEPPMWVADMSKTRKALGWEPSNSLDAGLEKSVAWYRKNLSLYSSII
jgi:nucleoside-diphosphate-sugar epimerase